MILPSAVRAATSASRRCCAHLTGAYSMLSLSQRNIKPTLAGSRICMMNKSTSAAAVTVAAGTTTDETASASVDSHPKLQHCPTLPFAGSSVHQYSKCPPMDMSKPFDYFPAMTKQFGEFYTMGVPGIGYGIQQKVHVIQDPKEMMKVLRSEGKFPSGAAESAWGIRKVMEEHGSSASAKILDRGPEWKRIRGFFQSDLMSPQSARQYVPAIAEVARYASRGVTQYTTKSENNNTNSLNTFLEDASFDMFASLTLGRQTRITDPDKEAAPEDIQFCRASKAGLTANSTLMNVPKELVAGKFLNVRTSFYKEFEQTWIEVFALASSKIEQFMERRVQGLMSESEKQCYLSQALARQEKDGAVTQKECLELVQGLLSASVDTTAGMTGNHFVHISMHPETQERIRDELLKGIEQSGGVLTAETVSSKSAPYLHAAFRESHRLVNPSPMVPFRTISEAVTVHGVEIPAEQVVVFDSISKGFDPNLVEGDPDIFNPDRWLPEAVEARKGTPAAVLDHPFFKEPFSAGARMCPGSRVAKNESLLLMAQLVLDWKMENPVKHWRDIKYRLDTVLTPVMPDIKFTARA